MAEQGIHQAHPPQLVHQGQVPFGCRQRPGEGARITGPGAIQLPAHFWPEPVPAVPTTAQQAQLHGKPKPALGVSEPETIETFEVHRSDRRHLAVIHVTPGYRGRTRQLAQALAGDAIGLLIVLGHEGRLQGGVVQALGAGHGQPAGAMALAEGLTKAIVLMEQELDQAASRPVIARGIEAVQPFADQGPDLLDLLVQGGKQGPALAGRAADKTVQELVGAGRGDGGWSGKHGHGPA